MTWLILPFLAHIGAAPVITQTGNAFGLRFSDSFHGGIARSGLLAILGDQLGPDVEVAAAGSAVPNLAGVSVSLSTSTQSFALALTSAGRKRVVALIPREAPAGQATVTVSYGGDTSSPASVNIVDATFGIATRLETGYGPAFASNLTGDTATLNSLLNPAKPGQQVMLYGTGLGVTGQPPIVFIGNFQAGVIDFGPAGCCEGVDQIQIVIPPGIEGCYVPVTVQIGNTMSNFVSMAIATGDGACSDPLSFTREELERIRDRETVRVGAIKVIRHSGDEVQAKFVEYGQEAFLQSVSIFGMPPYGTCTVNINRQLSIFTEPGSEMDDRRLSDPRGLVSRLLDAGPRLQMKNTAAVPTGRFDPVIISPMFSNGAGAYYGVPMDPFRPRIEEVLYVGSLQVTGPGGQDVAAFEADQKFPTVVEYPATLWAGMVTDNWVPGEPSPELLWSEGAGLPVRGEKYSEIEFITGGQVMLCAVPPGTSRFQVPAFVTLAIALVRPDGSAYIEPRGPVVGFAYPPAHFSADGIDIGIFFSHNFRR
jgi:uncharacterized protein (TIGR03437 family)